MPTKRNGGTVLNIIDRIMARRDPFGILDLFIPGSHPSVTVGGVQAFLESRPSAVEMEVNGQGASANLHSPNMATDPRIRESPLSVDGEDVQNMSARLLSTTTTNIPTLHTTTVFPVLVDMTLAGYIIEARSRTAACRLTLRRLVVKRRWRRGLAERLQGKGDCPPAPNRIAVIFSGRMAMKTWIVALFSGAMMAPTTMGR